MALDGAFANVGLYSASQFDEYERHSPMQDVGKSVQGAIDATPAYTAAIGLLALIALIGLKRLGFRFSFGASVGSR